MSFAGRWKMKKWACIAAALVVTVLAAAKEADAVTCSVSELSPCGSAIISGAPPSSLCCQKLREQRPCLCQYYRNPALRQYVYSSAAKRVSTACRVAVQC